MKKLDTQKLIQFLDTRRYLEVFDKTDTRHLFLKTRWKEELMAYKAKPKEYIELKKIFVKFLGFDCGTPRRFTISDICVKCHQCCGGVYGDIYKKTACKGFEVEPLLCLNSTCLLSLCQPLEQISLMSSSRVFTHIAYYMYPRRHEYWTPEFVEMVNTTLANLIMTVDSNLLRLSEQGMAPLLFPQKE